MPDRRGWDITIGDLVGVSAPDEQARASSANQALKQVIRMLAQQSELAPSTSPSAGNSGPGDSPRGPSQSDITRESLDRESMIKDPHFRELIDQALMDREKAKAMGLDDYQDPWLKKIGF